MAFTLTILDDSNHTATVSKQTLGRAGEAGEVITVVTPSSLYNLGYDAYLHFLLPDGTPVYKGSYPCTSASFTVTIGATDNILALEGTIIMQFVLINGTAYIWKSEEKRLDVVSAVNATAPATDNDYLYVQIPTTFVAQNLASYNPTTHKLTDSGYAVGSELVGVARPDSFTNGNIATYNPTTYKLIDTGIAAFANYPVYFNVMAYGAVGDGTTDDIDAIDDAITAATAIGGGVVYFPSGSYKVTSVITLADNIVLKGASRENTTIIFATASQTGISLVNATLARSYVAVQDLKLLATALNITAIASELASALRFENLIIAGCLWNFNLDRGTNIDVRNILVEGTATQLAGKSLFTSTDLASYMFALNIENYHVRNIGNGVQTPAITFNKVVGAHLDGYDVNDLSAGGSNADGLLITGDSQGIRIDSPIIVKAYTNGIQIVGADGSVPIAVEIINAHLDQCTTNALNIENGALINVIGGMYTSTGVNGIIIGTDGVLVQGVNITTGGTNGILVQSDVDHFRLLGNAIAGYGTAIGITAGSGDHFIVKDNDLSIGNTNKIVNGATGLKIYVSDNLIVD